MTAFETAAQAARDTVRHKDPLLRMTKWLLYAMMVIVGIVVVAMIVAIPGIWMVPNHIVIDDTTLTRASFPAITVVLAMILIAAVLGILFLRKIVAIIDSVKIGSPFVPENAQRLRSAAWLVLAIEGLSVLAESISGWVQSTVPKADLDIDVDFSFGWLVTALLLFILARVFDQGTKLAEDVEGIV